MKIIDICGKSQPDPYVIKSGNKFYLYCTGAEGVECYVSGSLICDNGEMYVVYHGRDYTKDGASPLRTARICKLAADNGTLKAERF